MTVQLTWTATEKKHNPARSREYASWYSMRCRCLDKRHISYPNYGGRGITICERWNVFANFVADMGTRPDGKTLDRVDTNGNYCPENCKWSTPKEQQRNARWNHLIVVNGQPRLLLDVAEELGIDHATLNERIQMRGVDIALSFGGARLPAGGRQHSMPKSSTGYKGVYRQGKRFIAQIRIGREARLYRLGVFDTPEEAALAYNNKAIELAGSCARLNTIPKR